jgi:hypothetical protein
LPEEVGVASRRGRRTPGLRREEVSFLADIGVKWYARLECGDEIHPSEATLAAVASALRLSNAELEYMLDLAGVRQPLMTQDDLAPGGVAHLQTLVREAHGIGLTVADRILTPLLWNDISDALYGHSRLKDPVERNALVRAVADPELIAFLGADREDLIVRAAGMLRLDQAAHSPGVFTDPVYQRVKDDPLFQRAWSQRTIADDEPHRDILLRNHAQLGQLKMYGITCNIPMRSNLVLRMMLPACEETVAKFARLEQLGKPQSTFTVVRVCS